MIPPLRAVLIYASLLCAFRGQSAGRLGRRNAARREAADENVDLVCEAAEAPAKSQGALRERDAVYGVRVRGLRSRVAGALYGVGQCLKFHMLEIHVPQDCRRRGGGYMLSEEPSEGMHAVLNRHMNWHKRTFCRVRDKCHQFVQAGVRNALDLEQRGVSKKSTRLFKRSETFEAGRVRAIPLRKQSEGSCCL